VGPAMMRPPSLKKRFGGRRPPSSVALEGDIPKDLPEFNFISMCSEKKNLITP